MMVDRISMDDDPLPTYAFLADTGHHVIDRYGFFNRDDPKGRSITHPGTLIIDMEGIVRYRFLEIDYKVRPTNDDLLVELARLEE